MRVYPDQIARNLGQLKQVYILFGDDPWLIDNCKQQIVAAARQQGFDERIQLYQEIGFNWSDLTSEWQALSLFSSKRIIELTLPASKPETEGANTFKELMTQPNPDVLLIIQGPKVTAEKTSSKWFKTLDSQGIYLPCTTPEGTQFQRWLDNRIKFFKLKLQPDARALLVTLYEGNLLAADQALQLLQLLAPDRLIDAEELKHYFEDQSRFTVFQLCDAILANKHNKAMHMLSQLKAEDIALPIILWALFKELNTLLKLKHAQQNRENLSPLWSKLSIWDKRKPIYQDALNRLSLSNIEHMLSMASNIELNLKQYGVEDWTAISHLCLLFDPVAHQSLAHIQE
ncbi:DNA polymerase III subunit delta [Parashewanella spongiae]|uniref:DNA polymerase III subunit delta n=1 Tax=Parashewanella spongiae TaxID=342950 RepID=A0A3A6TVV6_9GAMM|nr:DNA polymerase III subunit delta [Parashewanella spongiae]MCL1079557.1 DNA polymerase III subunit delta [Parashewanella spongiae]RJY18462.1 DNA polymerase III subunit delta [Parashewanella spongiae]